MINQIDIERKLAIINGFVEIPHSRNERLKNKLTPEQVLSLIPGSEIIQISGQQRGDARYIKLPAFDREDGYPEDWFAILIAAAS